MGEFIYNNESFYKEVEALVQDSNLKEKYLFLTGTDQMGKTYTLQHLKNTLLKDAITIHLTLDNDDISNPLLLRSSIIKGIEEATKNQKIRKKIEFIPILSAFIKGLNIGIDLPALPVGVEYSTEKLITKLEDSFRSYTKEIQEIQGPEKMYIEQLVNIVEKFSQASNEIIYILIDDCQYMDDEIRGFLNLLFTKKIEFALFVTYNRESGYKKNIDWLSKKIIQKARTNDLEPFSKGTIAKYLQKNLPDKEFQVVDTAEQIYQLTSGVPGYVSLLTNDIDTIYDIDKNRSFKFVMTNRFDSFSDEEKKIIEIMHINNNKLLFPLFNNIKEFESHTFESALENLVSKNIIEEDETFYKLKFPAMVPYISKAKESRIDKQLYQAYQLSKSEIDNEFIYLEACTNLTKKLKKNNEYIEFAIRFSAVLRENYKYTKSIELLTNCLDIDDIAEQTIVQLKLELIENLYLASNMKRIKLIYENMNAMELELLANEQYKHHYITVSKAYYYLNRPEKTIELLSTIVFENEVDKLEQVKLICSAYDLEGNYTDSKNLYYNFLENPDTDEEAKQITYIYVQMVEDCFDTCIDLLKSSIDYFSNYPKKRLRIVRYLATAYNNIGIEYLMNGDFKNSKKFLEQSVNAFKQDYPLEIHFPLNNLGLWYLLKGETEQSISIFEEANKSSISPLQKCYINQNLAIAFCKQEDKDMSNYYIDKAIKYSEKCPDPIVHNYLELNKQYLFISHRNNVEKITYLSKDQLNNLNKKRAVYNNEIFSNTDTSNRRTFFAEQDFEPCELMFYN